MTTKIYKTTTCPYCKMEAESGQMGVPFTMITKEDGSKVSILGFDKEKLDSALAG